LPVWAIDMGTLRYQKRLHANCGPTVQLSPALPISATLRVRELFSSSDIDHGERVHGFRRAESE